MHMQTSHRCFFEIFPPFQGLFCLLYPVHIPSTSYQRLDSTENCHKMKFYLLLGPHACLFQQHPRLSVRSQGLSDHQDRSERGLQPMRRNALRRRATSVSKVVNKALWWFLWTGRVHAVSWAFAFRSEQVVLLSSNPQFPVFALDQPLGQ
jgi:hypothetical protein